MNSKRLLLYYHTVKYLKLSQLLYNFIRRFFCAASPVEIYDVAHCSIKLKPFIKYSNKIDLSSVCFLNQKRTFAYIADWTCLDEPKLWRYNLHYFDFLLDDGASVEIKDNLIESWIEASHDLSVDAWEPYPVSLRIVNWIKYFILYKNNQVPNKWLCSLYQQADVLFHSIEHHILANHYLKNGKGLLFAGAYLNGKESNSWFEKGLSIVLEQAKEQLLEDGGHYEKSPMYHAIVTEDCLDIINLITSNDLDISIQNITFLQDKTFRALEYLNALVLPDGEIPLFNDSTFNIAPRPELILEYGCRLSEKLCIDKSRIATVTSLNDSGYYVIRDDQNMCVIDCGSVSPDYQPGHTHCDLLSYELVVDGQRCIVNSGVHDYENSAERQYCRSTRAHNTVEINGKEQSEVWGQFRVARRAEVLLASLVKNADGVCVFNGSYSPYWSGKDNTVHAREVRYVDKQWTISDTISGKGEHAISNFIHIHPDIECVKESNVYFLLKDVNKLAKITFSDNVTVSVEDGWYYPEFGIKRKNVVLRLSNNGRLPINQEYKVEAL